MNRKNSNLLLIFIKNPKKGKVKTRLAETVGEQKALAVYRKLLEHTISEAGNVKSDRQIWYSDFVDQNDEFSSNMFKKCLQKGRDLGERMKAAFEDGFKSGYGKIVIIGSDCPGITSGLIGQAFWELENHQLVVGPSEDGGYYLLGLNGFYPELFSGVNWSTDQVLPQTMKTIQKREFTFKVMPVLNDIDTAEDLEKSNLDL